jgi:hypothetical protein
MIKVSVMYPNTPGARFAHAYYRDKHMPLITRARDVSIQPLRPPNAIGTRRFS